MRRGQFAGVIAGSAAVALVLTACGGGSSSGSNVSGTGSAGKGGTITVGMLSPITGPYAGVGTGYQQGLQVAFDAANAAGGVLGGKKLVVKSTDESISDTSVSTAAARQFASQGVKILVGAALSQDCLAVAPLAQQLGMLNISPGCGVQQLIGPNRLSKTFFSAAGNDDMQTYGISKVLTEKYPNVKNLYTVNYDYVTGHEVSKKIRQTFQQKLHVGGQDYFAALGASDYTSVVNSLSAKATGSPASQGLILTNYGSGAITFLKQAAQAGLLKKFAYIGTVYEYYAAAATQNGAAAKVWDAYVYVHPQIFNNPVNTAFVPAYQKIAGGAYPNDWGFSGYITGLAIVQALKKANSTDMNALNSALEGMSVDGPTGTFTIDANSHHFLMPEVVGEIGGDKSAPAGVKLYDSVVIPGAEANGIG